MKRTIVNIKEEHSVSYFTVTTGANNYIFSKCNRMELQRLSHKPQNIEIEYFLLFFDDNYKLLASLVL